MTNEEKILQQLDFLTQEFKDMKSQIQPYIELKDDLQPIIGELVQESIYKLDGLGRDFKIENVADMIGLMLASSHNLSEGIQTLNRVMEFKRDFSPFIKEMVLEVVKVLDLPGRGFQVSDLQLVLRDLFSNMHNIAEVLKMLNSAMEFKRDVSGLVKPAVDELVGRLEEMKGKGVFRAFEVLLNMLGDVSIKLAEFNPTRAKPIGGVFGLLNAMKDPEVQQGLGVLIELVKIFASIKKAK